jgi:hypothetical protein
MPRVEPAGRNEQSDDAGLFEVGTRNAPLEAPRQRRDQRSHLLDEVVRGNPVSGRRTRRQSTGPIRL